MQFMAKSANISKRPKLNLIDTWQQLTVKWQQLSSRDRLALMILAIFLFAMILFATWTLHTKAKQSQQTYTNKVNDYFWLRSQAGNLKPQDANPLTSDGHAQPPTMQISSLLNDYGIVNPQIIASGNSIQFSFEHGSQATVSQALSQLQSQGFQLTNLQIRQDPSTHTLQVQASTENQ